MNNQDQTLREAGEQIAKILGEGPGREEIAAQRAELLGAVRRAARRKKIVRSVQAAAVATAVAAVAVIAASLLRDAPAGFSLGVERHTGAADSWFKNDTAAPLVASFGDQGRLTFAPGARGRIIKSTTREVRVLLEQGSLDADIKSAGSKQWRIDAGPFGVSVTGTAFNMRWDSGAAVLDVGVSRGAVAVFGIAGHKKGLTLSQGQFLRAAGEVLSITPLVSARDSTARDSQDRQDKASETEAPKLATESEPARVSPKPSERKPVAAVPAAATPKPAVPETAITAPQKPWLVLYKQGKYAQALEDAAAEGFDNLVATLGVDELSALADSARYARDAAKSRVALLAIRERFPESGEARTAAFLLGRVAMELDGRPDEGARWFRTYLAELPDGPLDEEAAGRLVDALVKAKRSIEAREAAQEYLKRYPGGIFAELARSAIKD
jgi:TolA-binding protein